MMLWTENGIIIHEALKLYHYNGGGGDVAAAATSL